MSEEKTNNVEEIKKVGTKKQNKEMEKYLNGFPNRREIIEMLQRNNDRIAENMQNLTKAINIQHYFLEAQQQILIEKGLYKEEDITSRAKVLMEEAARKAKQITESKKG